MSNESPTEETKGNGRGRREQGPHLKGGSRDARQTAAVVLETLAGAQSPVESAGVLGVSAARYYMIELRALRGLVEACEPRPRGPRVNPALEAERLQKDVARLEKDLRRQQALTRATQRAVGLVGLTAKAEKVPGRGKSGRRRKPTVRGLRAAQHLKSEEGEKPSQEG